jgi:hypothetical protein
MVELVRSRRTPEGQVREFEPTAQSISTWVKQAEREKATSPYEMRIYEGEFHPLGGVALEAYEAAADWLRDRLDGKPAEQKGHSPHPASVTEARRTEKKPW